MKRLTVRMRTLRGLVSRLAPIVTLTAVFIAVPFHTARAQVAPSLGTAQSFAVLGGSAVTNTGPTVVTGDLGVSPGTAVTGFPPGTVAAGTIYSADAVALQAQSDTTTAYGDLAGQACTTTFGVPTDLVGQTLVPGVYCFSSSGSLTGTLTLNAQGNPNAVWVFKTGSTFITGSNASVVLINGAQNCNVFWQVGSSATLGSGTTFVGNILALTSITLNTNALLSGRALARNGAVTMDSNVVAVSACAVPPITPIPPTVGKAFSPATINAGGNSNLTITLSNADTSNATLSAPLTDTLPSGVVVASGGQSNTCGGTLTAVVGGSTVTLTGASIPANGSCTVSVPVTAASGGNYINSIAAGALQTNNGNNAAPAIATLTVNTPALIPPTVGKAFSPATINAGGNSTLTITLSNTDTSNATLSAPLTDTLPSGVVVASGGQSNTCGGTLTAVVGGSTVTLTGASIPASGSCMLSVPVTAASGGNYINSIAAGALQTDNGNNAAPAIATLTVNTPALIAPTVGKAFSPATINAGGNSNLTITLSNTDTSNATLSAPLTDTLPSGVVVASGGQSNTCGGTLTAVVGGSTVTLTGASIPASGSCMLSVPVTAASGGNYINSIAAGALQTNNGNNAAPAIATLTVISPTAVALGKTFDAATINAGGNSTLAITLNNVGPIATLSAPLTDTLPSGVVVASGSQVNGCGGTLTAVVGGSTVTLTGASIPANDSCTVTVPVTAPVAGNYFNSLPPGALQTSNGNNALPAVATLTVTASVIITPTLSKSFSPVTINAGGESLLTITLTNPNGTPAIVTAPLIDYLPSGVVTSGRARNTCQGMPSVGGSTVTLTGGSIPANSYCTLTVYVTAASGGTYTNTLAVGALQTSNGNNAAPAVATLNVTPPVNIAPTLSKSFSPSTIYTDGTSTLTITLSNPNNTVATQSGSLIDNLPSGVRIAWMPYASNTCGGTLTATAGGSKVTLTGGSIPANSYCTLTVKVTANYKGTYVNTLPAGALYTDKGNNAVAAVATLTVKEKRWRRRH